MSLRSRATELARLHPAAERGELINLFINDLGMNPGTANSYASSVRNVVVAEGPARAMVAARAEESDAEIRARLDERFTSIDAFATASCEGDITSLIISGPAGLGKSFTIEQAVKMYDGAGDKSVIAKGYIKATGLYLLLHEYRHEGCVIVLDDADSIFRDEDALNILKGALDTTEERIISWRSETSMLDADGDPIARSFEFEGTVIFITNWDFDAEIERGGKSAPHFEALMSRSHYIECDMHSTRDYVIRIEQVCERGMLTNKGLSRTESANIVDYVKEHKDTLRELTLRMALKLADLYKMDPSNFEVLARTSCHKRGY